MLSGMQAQLWSELIASPADLEYMLFPRLLAFAERSWHKADWEQQPAGQDAESQRHEDWTRFANVLGHRELSRLDSKHIKYRIPLPGARYDALISFEGRIWGWVGLSPFGGEKNFVLILMWKKYAIC